MIRRINRIVAHTSILLFSIIMLTGCLRNEFKIEFDFPDGRTQTYRVLYYAATRNGGRIIESAAPVVGGKCKLPGVTKNPTIVFISNENGSSQLPIYVERGDEILISGDGKSPISWKVSGNSLSEDWTKWRLENLKTLESGNPKKINSAVEKHIIANKSSRLSTLLLLTFFNRRIDETGYKRLFDMLEEDARQIDFLQTIGRIDQQSETATEIPSASTPKIGVGRDSIHIYELPTDKAKATIMYFWRTSTQDRRTVLDSLESMATRYKHSKETLNVAAICFEPELINWRIIVPTDSATDVVHGWVPTAEANEEMMRIGAVRTPFFIVADKKGRQVYRGEDLKKAMSETIKLAGSPAKTDKNN